MSERLALGKAKIEARLNCRILFGDGKLVARCTPLRARGGWEIVEEEVIPPHKPQNPWTSDRQSHQGKFITGKVGGAVPDDNDLVLVGNVEGMEFVETVLPARVRFKRLHCGADGVAREIDLALNDGAVQVGGVSGEGKLNLPWLGGSSTNKAESQNVERGTSVVDGITKDQRDRFGDGFLLFNRDGALAEVWVLPDHEDIGFLREKGIRLPLKIIDVAFCSI